MSKLLQTAEDRRSFAQVKAIAHFDRGERALKSHGRLGLAATLAATIVGTSVFSSLAGQTNVVVQVATGMLSIVAAVLSALQTYLKFAEAAAQHKTAADKYQAVFHRLEAFLLEHAAAGSTATPEQVRALDELTKQADAISETAPSIPNDVYAAALARGRPGPFLAGTTTAQGVPAP